MISFEKFFLGVLFFKVLYVSDLVLVRYGSSINTDEDGSQMCGDLLN